MVAGKYSDSSIQFRKNYIEITPFLFHKFNIISTIMKFLFTTILHLTFVSIVLSQTNYFVNLSGNNSNSGLSENSAWRSISYAASTTSPVGPGDIVHIKAGDYGNENVVFSKSGTAANPIQFIGYQNTPGDNPDLNYTYGDAVNETVMPLLDGNDRTTGTAIKITSKQHLELHNLQIQYYRFGVSVYASNNLKVKNVIAMHFGDLNNSYDGKGMVYNASSNSLIEDCVVYNAAAEGIAINSNNFHLNRCRVFCDDNSTGSASATDYYIHIGGNSNLIEECYVERVGNLSHTGHGINLKGNCQNNIIRNCVSKMKTAGYQLRHRGVRNNLIENCVAIGCGYIIRDGASNNIIRNCRTESAPYAALFYDTAEDQNGQFVGTDNIFENCLFQNTTNTCINFYHNGSTTYSTIVEDNTFVNCVFDGGVHLFNLDLENYGHKISNSVITNVQNYTKSTYSSPFPLNVEFENSVFHNNGFTTPSGNNIIQANPQFVNGPNNDYHLTATSPCIDAGNNSGAPTVDYDGNPRPNNGIVDIGAFEFGTRTVNCMLSLFLEGAFNSSTNTMSTKLLQSNLLPAGQPYSGSPWNYFGTEGNGWSSSDYPSGAVDWVLISLRTTPAAEDEIARFAGIVLQNGMLYTLNDVAVSPIITQLYVLVEHRNHLPIMSALPVDIINNTITHDFRIQNSWKGQNGSGFGQKQVGTKWVMYGGNGDQGGLGSCDINAADRILWQTANGLFNIYNTGDYNLDSDINAADRIVFSYNNGIFTSIPKMTGTAPELVCPAPNYVHNNCMYTVNWTHPNPVSTTVNYDLKINGIDPGPSVLYPVTSNTVDLCSLLGISSGSGSFDVELFYWYDGDLNNINSVSICTVSYNF